MEKRSFMQAISTKKSSGFTIVELLVVMTVLGILITLVLNTLSDFYQANTTTLEQTIQNTDTRSVLRTIEKDLLNSNGFLKKNSMAIVSPTGPNNATAPNTADWDYYGNLAAVPGAPAELQPALHPEKHRVLIASKYATWTPDTDDNRVLVYSPGPGPSPANCDPAVAIPVKNNFIYFTQLNPATSKYDLYRRIMVGPGPYCAPTTTPTQKQSCKAGPLVGPCQTGDAILLRDIESFSVKYFLTPAEQNEINYTPPATIGDIATAKAVEITVTTNRKLNGIITPLKTSIRISPLNL